MLRIRSLSRVLPAVLSVFLLAVPQPAHAMHPHRDVKQQIATLEQQWRTATLNSDIALMDKLLSEDYVGISWTGQVNNKNSQLDRLRNRTLVISKMDLSDMKIKLLGQGQVAVVTTSADVVGTNDGLQINDTFRYTRVYQRTPNGAWKITNFEATRLPKPGGPGGRHSRNEPPPPR
jgi:ketosteroid isomerase-like protein